jgi:hypothetical protein
MMICVQGGSEPEARMEAKCQSAAWLPIIDRAARK